MHFFQPDISDAVFFVMETVLEIAFPAISSCPNPLSQIISLKLILTSVQLSPLLKNSFFRTGLLYIHYFNF